MSEKNVVLMILIALIMTLAACNGGPAGEPEKVSIQLSWFHSGEFSGIYVADQLGYYADENLDVTIVNGSYDVNPVDEVVAGNAQFGITTSDALIRANLAGQEVVAVSAIMRGNPQIVMALAESGIRTPQDLAGKTVGMVSVDLDTTWDIQFLAMLDAMGVDRNSITFVANQTYSAEDLKSGLMDASSGLFSTNELVHAILGGDQVTAIYLSDYGIETYTNPIFTTAQRIAENPDLVQRFVRATLKGYQYAIENPAEAAQFVLQYDPELDLTGQISTVEATIPLIDTGDAHIGLMDQNVWQITQDILLAQDVISSAVDLNKVYTNEFITDLE